MRYGLLLLLVSSLTLVGWSQPLSAASRKKLDNDIRYLVSRHNAYGDYGVAVVDHQGVVSQVKGDQAFPLASVFKLPLLLALLDGQAKNEFPSPSSVLSVSLSDQCIGSGRLKDQGVGASVSVQRACELMMSISDNTATDLLFRQFGTDALDPWLHNLGYKSSQIILTNRQAWLLSLGKVPGWGKTTPEARIARWQKLDRAARLRLAKDIEQSASAMSLGQFQAIEDASLGTQTSRQDNELAANLDNKMSALDLANMLIALDKGELLNTAQRRQALNIMAGQKYHTRLPKKLAASTQVFHKTGTLSGVRNDAGLLYTQGRDKGVAVVFLSQDLAPGASGKTDALAAQIAKLVEQAYR